MEKEINQEINDREERALALILQGKKDSDVADELGVSQMTIWRWKKYDIEFIKALDEKRSQLREQAEDDLLELTESAVQAIRDALKDSDTKTRLQAARMVLKMLEIGKGKGKEGSPVLELLGEAISGIKDELGNN